MSRLVVIDDDAGFCDTLRETLESEGFAVRTATDGPAGLALVRDWQPELVLCDLHMQGASGLDVLRALRRDRLTASVPVVFLTGDHAAATQRSLMDMGADDFLHKPLHLAELLRAIRARLARRKQVREETERRLADLRTSISHSVPHEFLTPLSAVLGLSAFLVDEGAEQPADVTQEAAATILAAGRRLHRLIEKFLLFTELDLLLRGTDARARRAGPHPTVDPTGVVSEVAARVAALCGRSADLHSSAAAAPWVQMPKEHLEALMAELVENACTFSDVGTPLSVSVGRRGADCLITVQDRGRGMAPEQIERFGAFVQFDRLRMEQPGTGLGLAIVARIAELAGGAVRIEGAADAGTTVTVRLPAAATVDESSA